MGHALRGAVGAAEARWVAHGKFGIRVGAGEWDGSSGGPTLECRGGELFFAT